MIRVSTDEFIILLRHRGTKALAIERTPNFDQRVSTRDSENRKKGRKQFVEI